MYIGKKVRELRDKQGLTLTGLSEKSGIQIATLSRIENQKMVGTLECHIQIAKALGVDLPELYQNVNLKQKEEERVLSLSSAEAFTYNDKASYEILANKVLSKKMMPVILKIEPGGRTNTEQQKLGSERFLFVLEGTVQAYIAGKAHTLSTATSLYFDASVPHYLENTGPKTAKLLSVATPVAL